MLVLLVAAVKILAFKEGTSIDPAHSLVSLLALFWLCRFNWLVVLAFVDVDFFANQYTLSNLFY